MAIRKLTQSSIIDNVWYKSAFAGNIARGQVDLTFNPTDTLTTTGGSVRDIKIQSDGKILVGGSFASFGNTLVNNLVRLNADYTVDTTFTTGTGPNSTVNTICILPNGQIIIGGDFTSFNGSTRGRIALLNSDGTLSSAAFTSSGFNSIVSEIKMVPGETDRILVTGSFTSYNPSGSSTALQRIAYLNSSNGAIITSPINSADNGFNNQTLRIEFQSSRIIVSGYFTTYQGVNAPGIIGFSLSTKGHDTSFNVGTGPNAAIEAMGAQSDGKIIIGGNFTTYNGTSVHRIIRLNSDGSLDTTWPNTNSISSNFVQKITVFTDNKVLVGGWFQSYGGTAARNIVLLNSNGTIDTSFPTANGLLTTPGSAGYVQAMTRLPNNNIIIGGNILDSYNNFAVGNFFVLNSTANLVYPPSGLGGTTGNFTGIYVDSNNKFYVHGGLNTWNGAKILNDYYQRYPVIRINADGTRDTSFASFDLNSASQVGVVQPDGKLVLFGGFTSPQQGAIRLNTDGTRDTSFTASLNSSAYASALQPDGKIIVAGNFTSVNGTTTNRIVRLNSNGTTDASFNVGDGFNSIIWGSKLQTDGKIIVVGAFTNYNGNTINRVARINSDGSLDSTFRTNIGTGANSEVNQIILRTNGKIVLVGNFTQFNGFARNRIVQLNSDGTIDNTFDVGTGFNGLPAAVILLPDDFLLVIGNNYSTYKGVNIINRGIFTIDPFGNMANVRAALTSSLQGQFFNKFAFQGNDRLLLSGTFTKYGDFVRNKIVRIFI